MRFWCTEYNDGRIKSEGFMLNSNQNRFFVCCFFEGDGILGF